MGWRMLAKECSFCLVPLMQLKDEIECVGCGNTFGAKKEPSATTITTTNTSAKQEPESSAIIGKPKAFENSDAPVMKWSAAQESAISKLHVTLCSLTAKLETCKEEELPALFASIQSCTECLTRLTELNKQTRQLATINSSAGTTL